MKKLFKVTVIIMLAATMLVFSGCKDEEDTAKEYAKVYEKIDALVVQPQKENRGTFIDRILGVFRPKNSVTLQYKTDALMEESSVQTPSSAQSASDFSDTNIQVDGVQEGDIVKTDGKYIYVVGSKYVSIVSATNGAMTVLGRVERKRSSDDSSVNVSEIYITENRLIALVNYYAQGNGASGIAHEVAPVGMSYYSYGNETRTGAEIYDTTDKAKPVLKKTVMQDGGYVSSRMIGNDIYIVSNHYIHYSDEINASKPETYVPKVYDDGKATLIAADSINVLDDAASAQYLIVSGIKVGENPSLVSVKSMFGCGNNVFCSKDNLYISTPRYGNAGQETAFHKYALTDGQVEYSASGATSGTILNQFSMDESGDYFRVVTAGRSNELSKTVTSVTIFDKDMKRVGYLSGLAPDERVYSVRFDGDVAFFVTFRQIDPLFAVDLATPTEPKVLSELKIPGFSDYLQRYGDGLLFGFGKAADSNGQVQGLKLSMFDVSDLENMSEVAKKELYTEYYSEANYNHKAILADASKNLIAFATSDKFFVYRYSAENGFEELAQIDLDFDALVGSVRGLYIGDYGYIVRQNGIKSYSLSALTEVAAITLE